ncbi:MAG: 4-(cytidine 5'-diphospho)-2-C-methyl-D-erythritol kinase [Pseudorhodoplanes sp.]
MAAEAAPARKLLEYAPAKINLTLRVRGRRADGFHELESLVAFAQARDALALAPGGTLRLAIRGSTAEKTGDLDDNLVLKAARALARNAPVQLGKFTLIKRLPVAAGLGGGSSDAAAALRLLARLNGLHPDDPRIMAAAAATGSDIPVCVAARARIMRGRGERLSPILPLPKIPALLINCGLAVSTRDVFAALDGHYTTAEEPALSEVALHRRHSQDELIDVVSRSGNDLEAPALKLCPPIADVLSALRALPGCRLARMSGSGATCFGLFDDSDTAGAAKNTLRRRFPNWWMQSTLLG